MKPKVVLHVFSTHARRELLFWTEINKGYTADVTCRRVHHADTNEDHIFAVVNSAAGVTGLRGLQADRIVEDAFFLPPDGWHQFKKEI